MRKAVIENGKVINVIETASDAPVGLTLPLGQILYSCDNYAVAIGDDFNDGVFTRDGEAVEPIITPVQQLEQQFAAANTMLMSAMGVSLAPEEVAAAQSTLVAAAGVEIPVAADGEWRAGEWVEANTSTRTRGGVNYICRQSHMTQADWPPDKTPALWAVEQAEPEPGKVQPWVAGEVVKTGDEREFGGTVYECIQGHTTQAGWTPPAAPALWRKK